MDAALAALVRRRAGDCCEYCRLSDAHSDLRFQFDHIIAQQHGGETREDNLAWSCVSCNSRKGPNIAGIDPVTGRMSPLFNPRQDPWPKHFVWNGALLEGLTPTGRATIAVLDINRFENLVRRRALLEEGLSLSE